MPIKEKSLAPSPTGRYVTIEEAAAEAGVAERTVQRWKKNGNIHAIRDRLGHVRVSLEDVMACRQEPSDSPLRSQVKQLQTQITQLSERLTAHQHQIEELQSQCNLGEQLVQALASTPGEASVWSQLAMLLEGHRSRSSGTGLTAQLARRGLPLEGTLRLKDFAEEHAANIHEIKKLYDAGAIGLTVYERPGEHKRNKREWWISGREQEQLVAYWQRHDIPYTPCPHCPHSDKGAGQLLLPDK